MGFVLIQMWTYAGRQPRIQMGHGRGDDGVEYARMAEEIQAGLPIVAAPPFVYRVGVPWLAARYARITHASIDTAFQQLNGLAVVVLMILIYVLTLTIASPPSACLT